MSGNIGEENRVAAAIKAWRGGKAAAAMWRRNIGGSEENMAAAGVAKAEGSGIGEMHVSGNVGKRGVAQ